MSKKNKSAKKASPERINNTILGGLETSFVHWFVGIAPDWVSPDLMSAVGMVGSIMALAGYALSNFSPVFLWLASFGFVLNWFGDSLDGNLARMRHIERPRFGYFIDHTLDTVSMLLVFVGLGFAPHVNMYVALGTFIAYLMMNIYVYINTQVTQKFKLSYAHLGPTEGRLMFVIANTAMFFFGVVQWNIFGVSLSPYDLFFLGWLFFLAAIFIYNSLRAGIYLYRAEPPVRYRRPAEGKPASKPAPKSEKTHLGGTVP